MSADEMPCGCYGHADYEDRCRYPALERRLADLEGVLRRVNTDLQAGNVLMARAAVVAALEPER